LLKKNQLALILLTLVLMLTVYYITSPFDKEKNPPEETPTETSGRLEELTQMRLTLREERALTVLSLDAIIASNEATVTEKENALKERRYLNTLTEKELLFELQVIGRGYRDCFVHASELGVNITVVAEEQSLTVANELMNEGVLLFGIDDVVVTFKTVQQVMGEVS
jgi:hypothetical protein